MAVEQDWAAYADQAFLATTDTLLARTGAGAGVELPGSVLLAQRAAGGPYTGTGFLVLTSDGANAQHEFKDSGGTSRAYIGTSGAIGSAPTNALRLRGDAGIALGTVGALGVLLDTSNNLLLGTTSQISGSFTSRMCINAGTINGVAMTASVAAWSPFTFFNSGGTLSGSVGVSGSSTSYNTSSDHRLKCNFRPLTGALDRIKALPVYLFDWIDGAKDVRGFKAHEYGEIIPGAATGEKDGMREEVFEIEPARVTDVLGADGTPVVIPAVMGKRMVPDYQGIDQSKAVPDLVAAVQELAGIVDELRAELAALKGAAK